MLLSQWKNKHFIIAPTILAKTLKSRRGSRAFAKLLPLFEEREYLDLTYKELAKLLGYRNKSGAHKAIKILESLEVVTHDDNGYLRLTMEGIIIR